MEYYLGLNKQQIIILICVVKVFVLLQLKYRAKESGKSNRRTSFCFYRQQQLPTTAEANLIPCYFTVQIGWQTTTVAVCVCAHWIGELGKFLEAFFGK